MASTDVMHDPNWLIANMAGRRPNDPVRAQMEAQLNRLQFERQQQMQQQQGEENRQTREDIHADRSAQRDVAQGQLNQYREGLAADKEKGRADRETLNLTHLLSDPTTPEPVRQAIQSRMLGQAGVSVNMPADPAKAALARSKGLPEPQGTTIGAASGTSRGAVAPNERPISPTGTQLNVDAGKVYGMSHPQGTDINTNTGEFVPSDLVGTINGKPSTQAIAEGALKTGVSPEDTRSRGVFNALKGQQEGGSKPNFATGASPDMFRGHGAGSSFEDESRPDIAGTARPGLNALKSVGSAIGGLFSGGQGGANQLVGAPTPAPGGPTSPPATPAPGTQFQGPLTATAGFLGTPNAPAPQPALTPPAIPPVNKPTPEEERRRLLAGQQ